MSQAKIIALKPGKRRDLLMYLFGKTEGTANQQSLTATNKRQYGKGLEDGIALGIAMALGEDPNAIIDEFGKSQHTGLLCEYLAERAAHAPTK